MSISVLIPVKDEEEEIVECLESAKWADEVIVLDNGSTDKTAKLVKSRSWAKYIFEKGGGYDTRKNKLRELAKGEWLFYLDADERITPLLREELINVAKNKRSLGGYAVPRRNFLLGKELKFGGWGEDYVMRFFRRSVLVRFEGGLHEQAIFEGPFGKLREPLIHFQPTTIEEAFDKSIAWSKLEAELFLAPGVNHPSVVWWRVLKMGWATAFERLIKKQGFRDGIEGWIESIYQGFHTMMVYLQLWELQRRGV